MVEVLPMEDTRVEGLAVATDMTVVDLHALPDDDGQRRELIDGELYVSPAPRFTHQQVVGNLYVAIRAANGPFRALLSPTDVQLDETTLVQPDVVVHSDAALAGLDPDAAPPVGLVPLVAIEVSSPSTRRLDLVRKRRLYEREGVAEYWFVDCEAGAIDVHVLVGDHYAELRTAVGDEPVPSDALPITASVTQLLAW